MREAVIVSSVRTAVLAKPSRARYTPPAPDDRAASSDSWRNRTASLVSDPKEIEDANPGAAPCPKPSRAWNVARIAALTRRPAGRDFWP